MQHPEIIGRKINADADALGAKRINEAAIDTLRRLKGRVDVQFILQTGRPDFERVRDWQITRGSFFTERHEKSGAKVAVLGQTVVRNLFGAGQDPIGTVVRISEEP